MKITVWGCRGSLPAPGPDTILYGGNTTCLEIRLNDGTLIIIDAGSGLRPLGEKLIRENSLHELYLLLTHAHWDHLMGFPFFPPAYSDRFKIHVCGGLSAIKSLKNFLEHRMEPPYFPVTFDVMKANFSFKRKDKQQFLIGNSQVLHTNLSHPNGGYGYKIIENGKSFVFLTDNELDYPHEGGLTRDDYIRFCSGVDLLMHDAQYSDEEYRKTRGWGHSTFSSATDLGISAKPGRFGIFHHDPSHDDRAMDRFVSDCRRQIAEAPVEIDCFGVQEGMEITL